MCEERYDIAREDLNPRFLFTCKMKRAHREASHCHDFTEICYIMSGKGEYMVDGKKVAVSQGDILIYNPGVYHEAIYTKQKEQMMEFFIAFDNYQFKDMPPDHFIMEEGEFLFHGDSTLQQKLSRLCSSISTEQANGGPGRYFMLKSYLIQFLLLLLREKKGSYKAQEGYSFESVNKTYVVEQMVNYINDHYREKISLDQIAKNMYLSSFYISKIFKSETGETPINYAIKIRLEKAKELFEKQEKLNVQEVAAYVGYDDAYHFSKLFKKHYGSAPSHYKNIVNGHP